MIHNHDVISFPFSIKDQIKYGWGWVSCLYSCESCPIQGLLNLLVCVKFWKLIELCVWKSHNEYGFPWTESTVLICHGIDWVYIYANFNVIITTRRPGPSRFWRCTWIVLLLLSAWNVFWFWHGCWKEHVGCENQEVILGLFCNDLMAGLG